MRTRERLLRALVTDIIADVDEATREVVLRRPALATAGPQAELRRARLPDPDAALAVMRTMATRWSNEHIAASLNRMGMPTGRGKDLGRAPC